MIVLFVILFLITICGLKFSSFNKGYISSLHTNSVKGIFAVIILFSHLRGYLTIGGSLLDRGYEIILCWLGQLMVALFLFYSGYGIMESIKSKLDYGKTFFRKRILKTLFHFDVAVLAYYILQTLLGNNYSTIDYITCWIGWSSIGNSNWFIFNIIALYLVTYPVLIKKISYKRMGVAILCLTLCLWLILFFSKPQQSWWIDTLLSYPLGVFYSIYKDKIESFMKNRKNFYLVALTLILLFAIWKYYFNIDCYGICACLFSLLFVMITMKVKVNNRVLQWLGIHAFAIYIMQRWPMIILSHYGLNSDKWLFVVIAIPCVLVIAMIYNKALNIIDKRFFG